MSETKKTIDVCSCCGAKAFYEEVHEAWACPRCGWLEPECNDPDCFLCRERPARPPAQRPPSR